MTDEEPTGHRWNKDRVEAFSDGVFAIAITLLVLDINRPGDLHDLGRALEHEWPAYLAYVTSFLTVGGVWVAHHRLFGGLQFVDSMMMRINLVLLMLTAFLPFPTGILAEALRAPEETAATAVVVYGVTVLVIELVLQAFVRYVETRPGLGDSDRSTVEPRSTRGTAGERLLGRWWLTPTFLLYVAAICIGLLGYPKVAAGMYLVLAIPAVLLIESRPRPAQT
jgi:uncharacterized membrane protein